MAGIGFRLQKLMDSGSYTDLVRAYAYSALIAAGPLLMVMAVLVTIQAFIKKTLGIRDMEVFMASIVYVYAFSMVVVGPFMYVVTRYLADKLYLKQYEAYSRTYFSLLVVIFTLQAFLAYFSFPAIPFSMRWPLASLYLILSGIWIAMIFLSAAKDYQWIGLGFGWGALMSVLFCWLWGDRYGLAGFINGFTLGQLITFLVLTLRIMKEFGYATKHDFGYMDYFVKHPYLILAGFFYYLGIWMDKFLFWLSPVSKVVGHGLLISPTYDTPMFLAYLTIVPSLAFFIVRIETGFAKKYQAYFDSIQTRQSFSVIDAYKNDMIGEITRSLQQFVLFQGAVSLLVILSVYKLAHVFQLDPAQMGIFRIGVLGVFLQMGMMILLNLLFYFDFQKEAFLVSAVFCLSVAGLTGISFLIGFESYGYGMATANFFTLIFAFYLFCDRLKNLNYWVFMRQPILVPTFKLETETTTKSSLSVP